MQNTISRTILFLLLINSFIVPHAHLALCQEAINKGFVYLQDIDNSIITSPRYASHENFTGKQIDGYKKPVIVLTKQAALALKKAQKQVLQDGYSLVVYDGYRPQKAVNNFMRWSEDIASQIKKEEYYPRINKEKVFDLGYVAKKSGHSRGSTVDLSLIKKDNVLKPITITSRTLLDGFTISLLDDGSVDMGSSWDLFDTASHYENNLIPESFKTLRTYLKNIMDAAGFNNYSEEWWHFTLRNEPYPANKDTSYFDFDVE